MRSLVEIKKSVKVKGGKKKYLLKASLRTKVELLSLLSPYII